MVKFDHLRIPVTDLARSRDWYLRTLSLTVDFEVPEQQTVALQDTDGFTIFLQELVRAGSGVRRNVLGFQTEFTYGEPTFYAGVDRDGVTIHLQAAGETKRQPGQGALNVFVTDVDALYADLKARGARTLGEPQDYPYGMRDFNVLDLDGNELCFGMESKTPGPAEH